MIDTKKYAILCAKRAELMVAERVYKANRDFILENLNRSMNERNFIELQTWHDLLVEMNAKLKGVEEECTKVIEEIKYT